MASSEEAGLAEMREELLRGARGETLEIGGGTGRNLAYYPAEVTALTVTEPDPFMAKRLRTRATEDAGSRATEVIEAPAEKLPFDDGSFDTVVSTLVMCTVSDPERASAEIRRVLRPDGRLLLIEHVRDPDDGRLGKWQDRLERPWGWFAGGCHPNRNTEALLNAAGFDLELLADEFPKAPPLARPVIRGVARRAA